VRIGFKELDPRILPDMGVKVTFLRETDAAAAPMQQAVTLVPQAAVKTDGSTTFVFLIVNNTVERRAVKVGGTDGDRVEVLAGLKGGDRVVVSPPPELAPGTVIEVKQ
jgi:multidrug efflux pump subunit AcrA (membrane-fusion protein)